VRFAIARLALFAPLLACAPGCALLGESEAKARWHDLIETPTPAGPAPEVAAPSPPTEEEEAIRKKDGLSVEDCMRLAVVRSERLHAAAERVHQRDLDEVEGYSNVFPNAHWKFTYFRQDPVVFNSFSPNESRTHDFVLSEPLFRGFRDWNAILEIRDTREREMALLRAERLDIALDCGRAFYGVVALERNVVTLQRSLALEEQRLVEVKAREASGIARRTETLFVETTRARTAADLARAREDLAAARTRLGFFTGAQAANLLARNGAPAEPAKLEEWLVHVKDRPDIAALAHAAEARRHEIAIARGELLPNVDVVSDLYARREGFLEDVKWDVQILLDWPIFEGGRTLSHIRRAESLVREAERLYADGRQRAQAEVEAAHHTLRAALAGIPALEQRVKATEENVKLLDAEYRAGIASNLEAVQAENDRSEAQLELERQLYEARRLELELRAASGDESLAPGPYPSSAVDEPAPSKGKPEKR
jgi:outer membrane protein TolC